MVKATFNGEIIAEALMEECEGVEGNIYFPKSKVKMDFLKKSETPYTCPWKGKCQYYDVEVDGKVCKDCAFEYPNPSEAAKNIKDHVAFWKDVKVE